MSPPGDTTAILPGHLSQAKSTCSAKGVPSFFSYFNTLSTGQARGIKPATTNSAVRCSSD